MFHYSDTEVFFTTEAIKNTEERDREDFRGCGFSIDEAAK